MFIESNRHNIHRMCYHMVNWPSLLTSLYSDRCSRSCCWLTRRWRTVCWSARMRAPPIRNTASASMSLASFSILSRRTGYSPTATNRRYTILLNGECESVWTLQYLGRFHCFVTSSYDISNCIISGNFLQLWNYFLHEHMHASFWSRCSQLKQNFWVKVCRNYRCLAN